MTTTARELEVDRLIRDGYRNEQIADQLTIFWRRCRATFFRGSSSSPNVSHTPCTYPCVLPGSASRDRFITMQTLLALLGLVLVSVRPVHGSQRALYSIGALLLGGGFLRTDLRGESTHT
jgi:hypothetical protein